MFGTLVQQMRCEMWDFNVRERRVYLDTLKKDF